MAAASSRSEETGVLSLHLSLMCAALSQALVGGIRFRLSPASRDCEGPSQAGVTPLMMAATRNHAQIVSARQYNIYVFVRFVPRHMHNMRGRCGLQHL